MSRSVTPICPPSQRIPNSVRVTPGLDGTVASAITCSSVTEVGAHGRVYLCPVIYVNPDRPRIVPSTHEMFERPVENSQQMQRLLTQHFAVDRIATHTSLPPC